MTDQLSVSATPSVIHKHWKLETGREGVPVCLSTVTEFSQLHIVLVINLM